MSAAGLVLLALGWSAFVWGAATLVCRLRPSPRTAQAIWRSAALMLIAPFAAALFMPGFPALTAEPLPDLPVLEPFFVQPDAGAYVTQQAPLRLPEIGLIFSSLVVAGWTVRLAFWLASQVRLQRLKARAMRVRRPLAHWAEAVGLSRVPEIRVIPHGAPFLAGLVRPTVFVPSALINTHDAPQVIVHEMVHLKRGDLVTRPLERLVADLVWFSPFAWMIRERLDYWREAVVDEAAAALTGDRIAYARALTRAARLARPVVTLPVAALILAREGSLKMRLTELLSEAPRHPRRLGLAAAAALLLAAPLALAQGMLIKGAGGLPVALPSAAPLTSAWYSHPVLDKAKLTSTYGERKHPITGKQTMHKGVDLAEVEGVAVYAPVAGWVTRAEYTEAYGNLVEVSAGDTTLRFAQLQDINVTKGASVTPGQVVGTLGQSGQATGPHLHLEVWHGGETVDPQTVDGLVLARELKVAAGAKPLAPLAPDAAPEPAAVPAPKPAPATENVACDATVSELKAMPRPLGWDVRLSVASLTNAAAGLDSENYVPKTVVWPQPTYPLEAANQGLSASCDVMFDLGTDGLAKDAVAHCSSPLFEESAVALPGAKFKPATDASGAPVEVKGVIYPLQYCIE